MNNNEKAQIKELRSRGQSYTQIADSLGLSPNTVKTFCWRHGLGGVAVKIPEEKTDEHPCRCCGKPVIQIGGRKEKRFCSNYCRNRWWNVHLDQVNRKANYEFECAFCKKPFMAYGNKTRKYCCHECYIADRSRR